MKYLKVEGAGRLRLRGGAIGLGSTSRQQGEGEEGISDPICAIPISDPTGEAEVTTDLQSDWRWPMLLKFEAKAEVMSSVSPFLISVFAAIRGLGLLPSVFRLGFGFFFFFLEYPWPVGLLSSHMLFFSLDWFCFLICCLGLMLGFGQRACSITFFFFFRF